MLVASLIIGGASYWQMQQSLRWWVNQASATRMVQADQIQNELMQDFFALRLNLVNLDGSQPPDLTAAATLHQRLNDLSAALSPPYLNESLPLAIQSLVQQRQVTHPSFQLEVNLPARWLPEAPERNRTVLTTLEALLRLADAPSVNGTHTEDERGKTSQEGIHLVV